MNRAEQIQERIRLAIIEEINVTNLITQGELENWLPRYIETLTNRVTEIVLDEIQYRR